MTLRRFSGDPLQAERWCDRLRTQVADTQVLLVLAGTATAAVPKLEDQYSVLEKMIAGTKDLPEAAQSAVGAVVKEAQGALTSKITEVLGLPGVGDILKPILDKITAGLAAWFK